jgi:hypothetical protein
MLPLATLKVEVPALISDPKAPLGELTRRLRLDRGAGQSRSPKVTVRVPGEDRLKESVKDCEPCKKPTPSYNIVAPAWFETSDQKAMALKAKLKFLRIFMGFSLNAKK